MRVKGLKVHFLNKSSISVTIFVKMIITNKNIFPYVILYFIYFGHICISLSIINDNELFFFFLFFFPTDQALHCKNMQKARELWDIIMTKGNAKYANMWLEYYNLERFVSAYLDGRTFF